MHAIDNAGLAEVLRAAFVPLAKHIAAAFIYGPAARTASVDRKAAADPGDAPDDMFGAGAIDVMVVGTMLTYVDLIPHLVPVEKRTGRKVSLSIYTAGEFGRKLADRNIVVASVMKQRKIFVLGTEQMLPRGR